MSLRRGQLAVAIIERSQLSSALLTAVGALHLVSLSVRVKWSSKQLDVKELISSQPEAGGMG